MEVSVSTGERVNSPAPAQFFIIIFKNNNDILKARHGNNLQATRKQKTLELLLPGYARVAEIKQIRLEEVLKKVILFGEGRPSVLKI